MLNLGIIIKHDLDNNIPIATDDELNLSPMGMSAVEEKDLVWTSSRSKKVFVNTITIKEKDNQTKLLYYFTFIIFSYLEWLTSIL